MTGFLRGRLARCRRWAGIAPVFLTTVCSCDKALPSSAETPAVRPGRSPTTESPPERRAPPPVKPNPPSAGAVVRPTENALATAKQTDFSSYWRELRTALLAADAESVARLTKFPFTVKGELDDDPVQAIERPAFPAMLRQLLAQDVGLSPDPEPLSHYLKRVDTVPPDAVAGTTARVASMQFALGPDGWRFVGAYLGESE